MASVFSLQLIESKDPEPEDMKANPFPEEWETIYWIIILSTTDGSQRWSGMEKEKKKKKQPTNPPSTDKSPLLLLLVLSLLKDLL